MHCQFQHCLASNAVTLQGSTDAAVIDGRSKHVQCHVSVVSGANWLPYVLGYELMHSFTYTCSDRYVTNSFPKCSLGEIQSVCWVYRHQVHLH